MYQLAWSETFSRTAKKFINKHPELRGEYALVLKQLENDPRHPRLKLHALKGRHAGKHAVSLTYAYRLVLVLQVIDKQIHLLDIGSHDDVYR
jgi:mRNA-degrading endonuclease YafQ of YafQ-DinJ toxin-antitoxin module